MRPITGIEQAYIVSFCDQNKLYPDLIRAFADHLLCSFNIDKADTDRRRVFASRQTLPAPKRRVENFDIIEPVLRAHRFEIEALGRLSAEAQARLFCQADVVVGGHGSDLANLLFCRPGTLVLVFENNFSVSHHLHIGLKLLCEVLSLDYEVMVCPTSAAGPKVSTLDHINQDYVVDPIALKARLDLIEDG